MTLTFEFEAPPLRTDDAGEVHVGNTRVTFSTVVDAFLDGLTPEAIVDCYDSLSLTDVYATITYYLRHRVAVDEFMRQRRVAVETRRAEMTARPDYQLWRDRLLARANAMGLRS